MLNKIRNSFLCKCLQALLVGYFLISSLNIANGVSRIITDNAETYTVKGITCNFLKKIFKCDGIPEELDDYKTKDTKTAKLAKGIPLMEYLVSSESLMPNFYFLVESEGKKYIDNTIFSFSFHGKIDIPPPRMIS
ncbi:hypothetical protein [Flavobacterium anhuiense]|uniref:hypothetical protein n=1 Tax=Flavobacterium anhuiense TaxID=459526 RepID=UPI000E6CEFB8|nr:hypothetical protein [Flavobacterium anhuiense]URM36793.1 hypothetical protein LLY39_20740 [Flavobacterium anhuiense]